MTSRVPVPAAIVAPVIVAVPAAIHDPVAGTLITSSIVPAPHIAPSNHSSDSETDASLPCSVHCIHLCSLALARLSFVQVNE